MDSNALLPPFRVRQLDPPTGDTAQASHESTVSMRRASYDNLLSQKSNAALRYIDHDDGEIITVGSGFELDQRLQETVPTADRRPGHSFLFGMKPLHSFDVDDNADVLATWKARAVKYPSLKSLPRTKVTHKDGEIRVKNYKGLEQKQTDESMHSGKDSTTSAGRQPNNDTTAHVGSKLGSAVSNKNQEHPNYIAHENRWASYANLGGLSGFQPRLGQPLFNSFYTMPPTKSGDETSRPLLEFFEAELAKLNANHETLSDGNMLNPGTATVKPPPSATVAGIRAGCVPATNTALAGPRQDQATQTQGSAPSQPLESILSSIDALAERVRTVGALTAESNLTIRQQLASLLQQSLPNNMDRTLRATANALESLKNNVAALHQRALADVRAQQRNHFSTEHTALKGQKDHGLVWLSKGAESSSAHGTWCLEGCSTPECPVIEAVKRAYSKQSPPSTVKQGFKYKPSQSKETTQYPAEAVKSEKFQAERIIARRYITYGWASGPRRIQYLVRWVGHGPERDIWYDEENLDGCKGLLEEFNISHPENIRQSPAANESIEELHTRTCGDRMITHQAQAKPLLPTKAGNKSNEDHSSEGSVLHPVPYDPLGPCLHPVKAEHKASAQDPVGRAHQFSPSVVMARFPDLADFEQERSWKDNSKKPSVSFAVKEHTPPVAMIAGSNSTVSHASGDAKEKEKVLLDLKQEQQSAGISETHLNHTDIDDSSLYAPPTPPAKFAKRKSVDDFLAIKPLPSADLTFDGNKAGASLRRAKSMNVHGSSYSRPSRGHASMRVQNDSTAAPTYGRFVPELRDAWNAGFPRQESLSARASRDSIPRSEQHGATGQLPRSRSDRYASAPGDNRTASIGKGKETKSKEGSKKNFSVNEQSEKLPELKPTIFKPSEKPQDEKARLWTATMQQHLKHLEEIQGKAMQEKADADIEKASMINEPASSARASSPLYLPGLPGSFPMPQTYRARPHGFGQNPYAHLHHRASMPAMPRYSPPFHPVSNFPITYPGRASTFSDSSPVNNCVTRLLEMGFRQDEAWTTAESSNGDLQMALDMLHEDREATEQIEHLRGRLS